ncbi:Uncharacterised protein [Klebsiella pneumoniae]|nr:Uncharacterised protein [Klebsiella pneumoniae]
MALADSPNSTIPVTAAPTAPIPVGINVLGLRQVLGFTAARHKRQLLTFGDFFDH